MKNAIGWYTNRDGRSELRLLQAKFENYTTLTTKRATAQRYSKSIETFLNRFPDKKKPEEFVRSDIEDYKIIRLREGISARTINYDLTVMNTFWRWMMDMGRITWNPFQQTRHLKTIEPKRVGLSFEEQHQLIKGCMSWEDRLLLGLALTTGLRGETLAALETSDVDFSRNCLSIPADKMKAGRSHECPLPPWLMDMLKECEDGRLFGRYAKSAAAISYRWNRICGRAGLTPKGIRAARRAFATSLIRAGTDLKIVQDLMGHKSIATTSKYIMPADQATVRSAVDKLPLCQISPITSEPSKPSSPEPSAPATVTEDTASSGPSNSSQSSL